MKAIVIFDEHSFGCQVHEGKMSDWQSFSSNQSIVVDFEPSIGLSNTVAALKALPVLFQYGNSFSYRSNFQVEIIK